MAKYFSFPFGVSGNRKTVPNTAPADGSINYSTGYNIDYERNPVTDPRAKMIEREEFNSLLFDITDALRELQTRGFPEFITPDMNDGVAYGYGVGAVVSYLGKNFVSLVANNKTPPVEGTNWREFVPFHKSSVTATLAQAEAGTGDNFLVSGDLRQGVRKTPILSLPTPTDTAISAQDLYGEAFAKAQGQISALKNDRLTAIEAGSSNVTIDNTNPLRPKISVQGSDASSAPTKSKIDGGDGVVVSDSADEGKLKRVAWSIIQGMLDGSYLSSVKAFGLPAKATVAAADRVVIEDSADTLKPKVSTIQSLWNFIKTQTDNLYEKKDTSVLLDGSKSMSAALKTIQTELSNDATADNHAIRFKQAKDLFLPVSSPEARGNLTIRRGGFSLYQPSDGAQNLLNFGVDGANFYASLYRDAAKNLSFVMKNDGTGASLRTPLTLFYGGGAKITGGATVEGVLTAEGGIKGSWMTLAANQPVNANDAATKRYVDEKTAGGVTVYTGTWQEENNYPIGHYLLATTTSPVNMNSRVWPRGSLFGNLITLQNPTGSTEIWGDWRVRGSSPQISSPQYVLIQKVGN